MKSLTITLTIALLFAANLMTAQKNGIPKVKLTDLNGEQFCAHDIFTTNEALIVIFWRTNDQFSSEYLTEMIEAKDEILANEDVKIIGICIDCNGSIAHIKPYVAGMDWNIEIYADRNGDLKRTMGILSTPSTIVFNTTNEVVCRYSGYCNGIEELMCDKLLECLDLPSNKDVVFAE